MTFAFLNFGANALDEFDGRELRAVFNGVVFHNSLRFVELRRLNETSQIKESALTEREGRSLIAPVAQISDQSPGLPVF